MTHVKLEGFVPTAPLQNAEFKISLKLHSIVMLVGPGGSGKTQFVNEQLMLQLKMAQSGKKRISIGHVSLDQILAQLLDTQSVSRDSLEARQVSDQAYSILFNQVRNFTSYPVNSDFVIIDATGLDPDFRAEILKIGEENYYSVTAVVFDYDDKAEYFIVDSKTGENKKPHPVEMKDLKRTLSGGLVKKDYSAVEFIRQRDFNKYEIEIDNYSLYDQYILSENNDYVIFGDIHGCLEEFQALLNQNGFVIGSDQKVTHPDGKKVVLVGDIIDKGSSIKEVIEFVYINRDVFFMVIGNHENFVYKALKGVFKKSDMPSQEVVNEYFNTYHMLNEPSEPKAPKEPARPEEEKLMQKYEKNLKEYLRAKQEYDILLTEYDKFMLLSEEEKKERRILREKFFAVFESMKAFLIHKNFIVTHAPCEKKFLGKISPDGLRAARDFRYPKMMDFEFFADYINAFDEHTKFVRDEASENHPIHVFGHVMTKEMSKHKNKINIDTGCVAGGALTSIQINEYSRISHQSVSAGSKIVNKKKELHNFFN